MVTTIKMQARGVLTLPKKLRENMRFAAGSIVHIEERDGGVFIAPASPFDALLQEDVRRALDDLKNGRTIGPFSSMKDFERYRKSKRALRH
jgi:bifunctional DNA-binding transcriptional regulator/antitoxin component of YhaV-PrlF toxin-antitoxin module